MDDLDQAKALDKLNVEIGFQLEDSFYIGKSNSYEQLQNQKYYQPIQKPSFERIVDSVARTGEILSNEDELASYYKTLIVKAKTLNKDFNDIRQYFWLRLGFWNTKESIHLSFPWYDHLYDMQKFFSWLKEQDGTKQDAYVDLDQGWEIQAICFEGRLYLRQADPDYAEEYANISLPLEAFKSSVIEVEARAVSIISQLSESIGLDVWSKHLQDAEFDTSKW